MVCFFCVFCFIIVCIYAPSVCECGLWCVIWIYVCVVCLCDVRVCECVRACSVCFGFLCPHSGRVYMFNVCLWCVVFVSVACFLFVCDIV